MKTILQMGALTILSVVIGLALNAVAGKRLPLLATPEQFEVKLQGVEEAHQDDILNLWNEGLTIFVDARSEEVFAEGHIPGAFSIPYKSFEDGTPDTVDLLSRDEPLVIYCDGADCHASKEVYDHLLNLGFTADKMKIFHGGWKAWQELGGEVESDNG